MMTASTVVSEEQPWALKRYTFTPPLALAVPQSTVMLGVFWPLATVPPTTSQR